VAASAQRIAEREAQRLYRVIVRTRPADVRVRAQGLQIFIDVDVEGPKEG
jgi:hypothetical protein